MIKHVGTNIGSLVALVAIAGTTGCVTGSARQQHPPVAIIVPEALSTVRLGFDVLSLRRGVLLCYRHGPTDTEPRLHAWSERTKEWGRISEADYVQGSIFTRAPSTVVVLRSPAGIPAALSSRPLWAEEHSVIVSSTIGDILNELNRELAFSAEEWKWLAPRHHLRIEQQPTDRYRAGRRTETREQWQGKSADTPHASGLFPVVLPIDNLRDFPLIMQ